MSSHGKGHIKKNSFCFEKREVKEGPSAAPTNDSLPLLELEQRHHNNDEIVWPALYFSSSSATGGEVHSTVRKPPSSGLTAWRRPTAVKLIRPTPLSSLAASLVPGRRGRPRRSRGPAPVPARDGARGHGGPEGQLRWRGQRRRRRHLLSLQNIFLHLRRQLQPTFLLQINLLDSRWRRFLRLGVRCKERRKEQT